MKIILLSGFLGAGKTSVLLQLARYLTKLDGTQASTQITKVAILENEIGQVSVDSATLAGGLGAGSFELRELFSGCVCCSLTGEMIDTVRELDAAIHPQWLIIEATGLAVPENAATVLREGLPDLQGLLTVVLIDVARFLVLEKVSPLVAKQASGADVLLLNKVDLASEAIREQVMDRLTLINSAALSLKVVASKPIDDNIFAEMIRHA